MIKLTIVGILIGVVWCEVGSYRPSGWRPNGPSFEPIPIELLQTYGQPSKSYGVSSNRPTYPHQTVETTDIPTTTSVRPPTTTTPPRTREPTTPDPDITDEDVETGPALAIANSFAFNRPVYVYNTYPLHSGLTFVR